jgi:hypothetical protein
VVDRVKSKLTLQEYAVRLLVYSMGMLLTKDSVKGSTGLAPLGKTGKPYHFLKMKCTI